MASPRPPPTPGAAQDKKKGKKKSKSRSSSRKSSPSATPEHRGKPGGNIDTFQIPAPLAAVDEAARTAGDAVAKAAVEAALLTASPAQEPQAAASPKVRAEAFGGVTKFSVNSSFKPIAGKERSNVDRLGVDGSLGVPSGISERPVLTQPSSPGKHPGAASPVTRPKKTKKEVDPLNRNFEAQRKDDPLDEAFEDSQRASKGLQPGPIDQIKAAVAKHIGEGEETFYGVCAAAALVVGSLGWALMRRK